MSESIEVLQARIANWQKFLETLPARPDGRVLRESIQRSIERADAEIAKQIETAPPVNEPGPGEGPIAWPTDKIVIPAIAKAVGEVVNKGLLPEVERQKVTASGPKAFFGPQDGNLMWARPTIVQAQDQRQDSMFGIDSLMAALKEKHQAEIEAIKAQYAAQVAMATVPPVRRTKIPANPKIGVAICTYGSVPYVHLGLECLKRHEPGVPVLIHDDSSPDQEKLRQLAAMYGADFVSTDYRKAPTVGDLSGFVEGLRWGADRLDIVIKLSRRFIIDKPWASDLGALFHNTQYGTACAPDSAWQWGMRSEATGLHVSSWINSGMMARMEEAVRSNVQPHSLPEAFIHECAREVHKWLHPEDESISRWNERDHPDCDWTVRSEKTFNRPVNYDSYVWWVSVMGLARTQLIPNVYWHDSWSNREYGAFARSIGLNYTDDDFYVQPGN